MTYLCHLFCRQLKNRHRQRNLDLTTEAKKNISKKYQIKQKSAKQKTRYTRPFCVIRDLGPIIHGLMRQGNV